MAQRILVAEDDMVVGFDLCDTVAEAGYDVEGPHRGMSSAIDACEAAKPDLAILDVTLDDGEVYPLAKRLEAADVPIIFYSGRHTPEDVKVHFPQARTLLKPCPPAEMLEAVNDVLEECAAARD